MYRELSCWMMVLTPLLPTHSLGGVGRCSRWDPGCKTQQHNLLQTKQGVILLEQKSSLWFGCCWTPPGSFWHTAETLSCHQCSSPSVWQRPSVSQAASSWNSICPCNNTSLPDNQAVGYQGAPRPPIPPSAAQIKQFPTPTSSSEHPCCLPLPRASLACGSPSPLSVSGHTPSHVWS